ncbi:tail fiber domain-containing protein [Dyadobacter sp. CY261]|uniref:tail fiber domain-containing protein n=1 Tax=Dyadobacter sp. CY261 TaxID=2907203 RepID=UPI001F2C26F2|nr:tail fiber domain-containing protein [Dyadobacter sp. CY261]MCF0074207.1 tail fiber domain-containing protein [Dyadobacter sp. CY261]
MKIQKTILLGGLLIITCAVHGQGRLGINTNTPRAGLDVKHPDGIIATGTFGAGNTSNLPSDAGTSLLWIPKLAAFRAGQVDNVQWFVGNIGEGSVAMGINVQAQKKYSVAMGYRNTASGEAATVFGNHNSAHGRSSTAFGEENGVDGHYATAFGKHNQSHGLGATAFGTENFANGQGAVAMGFHNNASGVRAFAFGTETIASGDYSTAIGSYVSTANKTGSFIIGDALGFPQHTQVSAPNKFTARFANGYLLYSSANLTSYVALGPGGNAWISSSDSTRKTNFVKADGEDFLRKVRGLRLGSWNYKQQDAATMRHYGPMAQDFFAAYGKDLHGTIGNDTTLNTADVDGVAFILIQALEKRTMQLNREIEWLKTQLAEVSGQGIRQKLEAKRD